MFNSSTNRVFFLLVVLIFTTTNVFSDCDYGQTCRNTYTSWCCSYDQTCGSSYLSCEDDSSISPTIIAIIIVFSVFFFVMCLTCCLHSHQRQRQQRLRAAYTNSNPQYYTNPYDQQILRGQVRVVHVRPIYNVEGAPPFRSYPSIYEAPPPSYDVATANTPQIHQTTSSLSPTPPPPPVTATVQQSV